MANPAPIYQVEFNNQLLPGYVQSDNRPISIRKVTNTLFGMDGGTSKRAGADLRRVTLSFRILSSLGSGVSDLLHLEDCMDQYRAALAILARVNGEAELRIHDTDRYYLASFDGASAPFSAGESRRITYDVEWTAQPWAFAETAITDTFTGNDTLSFVFTDTRRTYPVYSIPSGVTAFTAVDNSSGKTVQFLRGSVSGTVVIDTGKMTVTNPGNAVASLVTLDFGQYYDGGAGTYGITVTGFAGSGTVTVSVRPRYEL